MSTQQRPSLRIRKTPPAPQRPRPATPKPHSRKKGRKRIRWWAVQKKLYVALASVALLGITGLAVCKLLSPVIPLIYLAASTLAFLLFYTDKRRAIAHAYRISEVTLHLTEILCGWPGAIVAQVTVRHKNRKLSFQVLTVCNIIANVGLLTLYAYATCKQ